MKMGKQKHTKACLLIFFKNNPFCFRVVHKTLKLTTGTHTLRRKKHYNSL